MMPAPHDHAAHWQQVLHQQQAAHREQPMPSARERQADLAALARLLQDHREALANAIEQDYGTRAHFETLLLEQLVALGAVQNARRRVARWMRVQNRHVDFLLHPGARARVIPQPLGVVGVIVPWNFPLNLTFCPLASILAAGNRAMVKLSEHSPHFAALLTRIGPAYFPPEKLQFFADPGGLGSTFSALPFNHLLFTGSSATGRAVMAQAATHLTPLTLELGGKSPAIVAPDYSLRTAAERILWAKLLNAGQICTSVDQVFLPTGSEHTFVAHCQQLVAQRYPDLQASDYTALIHAQAYERMNRLLDDARAKGATVINLAPQQSLDAHGRKLAPHLVLQPRGDMLLSQQEIFGPILAVHTYRDSTEVVNTLNAQPLPLALYLFTHDRALQQRYITQLMSGGVCVNDTLLHVGQHDLPFGGIGASGMGHYHGREGFETFSKLRPVFYQGRISTVQALLMPPYRRWQQRLLAWLLQRGT